jgi:hypothetical protein
MRLKYRAEKNQTFRTAVQGVEKHVREGVTKHYIHFGPNQRARTHKMINEELCPYISLVIHKKKNRK